MHGEWGNWAIDLDEEWSQWFGHWPWRTFTLAHAYYENDTYMGNWDAALNVLGVGIRIAYLYNRNSEGRRVCEEAMKQFFDGDIPTSRPNTPARSPAGE